MPESFPNDAHVFVAKFALNELTFPSGRSRRWVEAERGGAGEAG